MKKSNFESGQSTIEFILTFVVGLSLILTIFNSALNYAAGYMVHYATFMASRAYLTYDRGFGDFGGWQTSISGGPGYAQEVFKAYNLSIFDVPDDAFKINEPRKTDGGQYLTVGGYTTFEQRIDAIGRIAGAQKLELVSESFLGKEPTKSECATRVCRAVTGSENCLPNMDVTLWDDGC